MKKEIQESYIELLKRSINVATNFLKKKEEILQLPVPFKGITQPYGTVNWSLYPSTGRHWGLDLRAALGTPVTAPRSGEVIESSYNDSMGYYLQFFDGKIYHVIPHLKGYAKLGKYKQGQKMQEIALTGRITGVHCHLECWNKRMTDRINQLKKEGTVITMDPAVVYKLK
jgi:murein DD-endopeptidase MepM/ murein hydrolase activator NlpD